MCLLKFETEKSEQKELRDSLLRFAIEIALKSVMNGVATFVPYELT